MFKKYNLSELTILLLIGTAMLKAASCMSIPFMALFLLKHGNLSPLEIGLVISTGPFAALIGSFFGGQLSDLFGRKHLLWISLFGSASTFIGFYFASFFIDQKSGIVLFALLNILSGLLTSIFTPVSQALISDTVDASNKYLIFQLRYFSLNAGAVVGPLMGAAFGATQFSANVFLLTGIIYAGYALLLFLNFSKFNYSRETTSQSQRINFKMTWHSIRDDSRLLHFILAGIIFNICYSQLESSLSQVLASHFSNGVHLFPWLIALNAAVVITSQLPISYITKNQRPGRLLIYGNIIFAIGYVLFSMSMNSVTLVFMAMIISTLGEVLVFPTGSLLIDNIAPTHLRGTYFGAANLRQLGLAIGPIAGGFLFENYGAICLFLVMAVLALVSCSINSMGEKILPKNQRTEEPLLNVDCIPD